MAQHPRASRGGQIQQGRNRQGFAIPVANCREHPGILFAQQRTALRSQHRGAPERGIRIRPAFAQQRKHAMAQEIAIERSVGVAGILDPDQRLRPRMGLQCCTRRIEQWPPHPAGGERSPRTHRGQTVRTGGAQGAQQEGFGLIVAMLRQRDRLSRTHSACEHVASRMPRRCFRAHAAVALDCDPHDVAIDTQSGADSKAMHGPEIGVGLQAVVDMERAQAARTDRGVVRQQMQ